MSSQPTLKFLGAAIVAAAFSTGAMAQTSSTPGSAPASGAMSNSSSDSGSKASSKTMKKHKAEKDHGLKANPNAKEMKDGPMGTSPGGNGGTGGAGGAGAGGAGAGASQ